MKKLVSIFFIIFCSFFALPACGQFEEKMSKNDSLQLIDAKAFFSKDTTNTWKLALKGRRLQQKKNYDSACYYYEQASKIYLNQKEWRFYILCAGGSIDILVNYLQKYDIAILKCEKALENIQILSFEGVKHDLYSELGSIYYKKDEIENSFFYSKKQLEYNKKYKHEIADQLINLGILYSITKQYDKAELYIKEAIDLDEIGDTQKIERQINAYNVLAINARTRGYLQKSIKYYELGLSLVSAQEGWDKITVFNLYYGLSQTHHSKKDYAKSLFILKEAEKVIDGFFGNNPKHPIFTKIYDLKSLLFSGNKQLDSALVYAKKVMGIRIDGRIYRRMAYIYKEKTQYDSAYHYAKLSLEYDKQKKNVEGISLAGFHLAIILNAQGKYKEALVQSQKTIAICFNNFSDSLDYYKNPDIKQNPIIKKIGLNVLQCKVLAMSKLKEFSEYEIKALYDLFIKYFDKVQDSYVEHSDFIYLQEDVGNDFFQDAIAYAYEVIDFAKAFQYAERNKYNIGKKIHFENKVTFGVDSELAEAISSAKAKINYLDEKLYSRGKADSTDRKIRKQILEYTLEYEKLKLDLRKSNPNYYKMCYETELINVDILQSQLLPTQVVLEYAYLKETVLLFAIAKGKFKVYDLKIKPDSLNNMVRAYRRIIFSGGDIVSKGEHLKIGEMLYKTLLGMAAQDDFLATASYKHLLIIPQSDLSKLPFEALFSSVPASIKTLIGTEALGAQSFGVLPYVIKDFQVSYYPSATLAFGAGKAEKRVFKIDMLNFAPVFKNNPPPYWKNKTAIELAEKSQQEQNMEESNALKSYRTRGFLSAEEIPYLKHSEEEAKNLEIQFKEKGKKVLTFLNEQATEGNAKKHIPEARIVHLNTHSFFNAIDSDRSGVIAHQPKDSLETADMEDGMLYAEEIYNMRLQPELLIMSSCQGGVGKYVAGEGMLALNRAFMYAGAENIIYSLWKVDDASTKELMQVFYQEMLAGKDYAYALQQAKISLLKHKDFSNPSNWAGFVLNWKQ